LKEGPEQVRGENSPYNVYPL